jgi:hypothetical protein
MRDDILAAGQLFYSGRMWVREARLAKRYADHESVIRDMAGFNAKIVHVDA